MTRAVHHLDCGSMCPVAGRLIGGPSLLARGHMVCHCLLAETDHDGLILIETGFGTADCTDPRRLPPGFRALVAPRLDPAETALARITALGYRPEDVRHIVVTHLDPDHAGGLPDFPWATVHVHRFEHEAAMRRNGLVSRVRYMTNRWAHGPRWATYEVDGETWMGLPAVRPLDGIRAEIALVPLFGHTHGHSAVALRRRGRWLLHAGDAYYHRDELAPTPRCPPGLRWLAAVDQVDRARRLASIEALRQLRARHDDIDIVCAHDPVELERARA